MEGGLTVHRVRLGVVNAFLVETGRGLVLVDTGYAGSADRILGRVRGLGYAPSDVRHILVTHAHPDHAGSAAELKRRTGAAVYMHPSDSALVREGRAMRPLSPSPGVLDSILFRLFIANGPTEVEAFDVDVHVADGETLELDGVGFRAHHLPGHCAGQLVFTAGSGRGTALFAADAAANILRLGPSIAHEDHARAREDCRRLAGLRFDAAHFGHGRSVGRGADLRFRRRWGET